MSRKISEYEKRRKSYPFFPMIFPKCFLVISSVAFMSWYEWVIMIYQRMRKGIRKRRERRVKYQRRTPRMPEIKNIVKEIFVALLSPNEVA